MTVQTSYTNTLSVGREGDFALARLAAQVMSKEVAETNGMPFGRAAYLKDADGKLVRLPRSNQADLTLDADLIADNILAGNIVVNGTTTAYTETYATSSVATLTALAAELDAIAGIASATVVADDAGNANRRIRVVADAETDVHFSSGAVTGGVTQAAVTLANTESKNPYGLSTFEERQPESNGLVLYPNKDTAGVARRVYLYVRTDSEIKPGDTVFVRFFEESAADKKRGMITDAAGSSPTKAKAWTEATVHEGAAAGGLAVIAINLP